MTTKRSNVKKLSLASMFLALGVVLPFFTGQIKEIGDTLLPMHIPVMLCGFICGQGYGAVVGLLLPFVRSAIVGMPPIYPNAIWMATELATYGFVVGLLYKKIPRTKVRSIYLSMGVAMVLGRIVWGITKALLLGIKGQMFTFEAFIIGGLIDAIPGIILQLILVPIIVYNTNKSKK